MTKLSTDAREKYIRLGWHFGFDDTLKQANKTLETLHAHPGKLGEYGFGADDSLRLTEAWNALRV